MKIEDLENISIIKNKTDNVTLFLEKITRQYNSYKNKNLIIDISFAEKLTHNDIILLNKLVLQHKKEKKSLVVVNKHFDSDQATDKIIFVPTLQEAHDVIEMEEIERDLGF